MPSATTSSQANANRLKWVSLGYDPVSFSTVQYDLGLNYFINKHNAKVTLQYGARPVYKYDASSSSGIAQNGLRGQITLQMHFYL